MNHNGYVSPMKPLTVDGLFDIHLSLGCPTPVPNTTFKYLIKDVLEAMNDDDADCPIQDFDFENKKWIVDPLYIVYDKNHTQRILWQQCTFGPLTFMKIFQQCGWKVVIYNWSKVESIDDDTVTSGVIINTHDIEMGINSIQ